MISSILNFFRQTGGSTQVKGEAIRALLLAVTGENPSIQYGKDDFGDFVKIGLSENQNKIVSQYIEAWLDKSPGEIRLNVSPIISPIIMKKAMPWAFGGGILGFFGFKMMKGK